MAASSSSLWDLGGGGRVGSFQGAKPCWGGEGGGGVGGKREREEARGNHVASGDHRCPSKKKGGEKCVAGKGRTIWPISALGQGRRGEERGTKGQNVNKQGKIKWCSCG